MAQLYLSDFKQKTWRGQLGRALQGKVPGGTAYGYGSHVSLVRSVADSGVGATASCAAWRARILMRRFSASSRLL
jgi:hypothetical protein